MHTKCWSGNLNGRVFGRPRHRWYGSILFDLKGIRCLGVDLFRLAQEEAQLVCFCEHSNEPLDSIKQGIS
jgi:hypothetical protein